MSNHVPDFYRQVDDLGIAGGGEDEIQEEQQEQVQEEAPVVDVAAIQRDLQAANEQIEALRRQQSQSVPQTQMADPNIAYRAKLEEIAYETDPVKQEEMRMELAEQRVQARLAPELSHSRAQGATAAVLRAAKNVDSAATPFIEEVIAEYGLNVSQVDAKTAQDVADMAWARANRAGKITSPTAPTPATKAPISAAAPTTSPARGASYNDKIAPDEKAYLERYMAEWTPPGADPKAIWTDQRKNAVLKERRQMKEYQEEIEA